eukprot:GHVP01066617.1.p1 GENE.GHVP01066617.1~~GHVP01066617.1.p1  ORF type:complete len:106 (+),score=10.38 GHVP01066617.1:92-409(+)
MLIQGSAARFPKPLQSGPSILKPTLAKVSQLSFYAQLRMGLLGPSSSVTPDLRYALLPDITADNLYRGPKSAIAAKSSSLICLTISALGFNCKESSPGAFHPVSD